jgi:uncharacterized protein (DUF1800 family)
MRRILIAAMFALLAACGGGGGGGGAVSGGGGSGGGGGGGSAPPPPPPIVKPTAVEASRLLAQATFGPTDADIAAVMNAGVSGWIDGQIASPMPAVSNQAHVDARRAELGYSGPDQFYETWWRQSVSEPGQLRQRVAFALSQIFVISFNDTNVEPRGGAAYYDMLEADAFANFRKLLEDVTLNPMMGRYLTYLANQKEDPNGTRIPDENYAREVMQLMTIGLVQLNTDGSPKLDSSGAPLPTYGPDDVRGMARVLTGISWYTPKPTVASFFGYEGVSDRNVTPMMFYPAYHSTSAKTFLGVTIPAAATPDPAGDLKTALDTLYNHPNVGPFIGFRLIQQLVTSNPSPAYIGRVATVFNNNGSGVRGDMGAVVKAILTDPEARDASVSTSVSFGKLREPLIRATNWMRAFGAKSQTGDWLINTTSANTSLGQSALTPSSVFNFWRPHYTPPDTTELGSRNLLAPEFQAVDEITVAAWVNNILNWIDGAGVGLSPPGGQGHDIQVDYTDEIALADTPSSLVDRMNTLFFGGAMSATLQGRLNAAIAAVGVPTATGSNQTAIATARLNRVKTAIFLSMISPEYLIQR